MRRFALSLVLLLAAAFLLTTCMTASYKPDAGKPHHGPDGYRNNYPHDPPGSFWKWQWERRQAGLPKEPPPGGWRFETVQPDAVWLRANRTETTATWIGHATVLLQTGGLNFLTDPHFTERAGPMYFFGPKREQPPALALEQLPHIDAVLISHNHYDHLDLESVRRLAQQPGGSPRFFVPLGLKAWFAGVGIAAVQEMDWWDSAELGGVRIHMTPVQHWSRRSLNDRNQTLWGGWAVIHPGFRFFFPGDTAYSQDFGDINARLGPFDLAALPIGAYEPRWFMRNMHINPEEAVRIHKDIRARQSIAIHWGTFVLTDEPLDEPPVLLARAREQAGLKPADFLVLKHGETLRLPKPGFVIRPADGALRANP